MPFVNLEKPGYEGTYEGGVILAMFLCIKSRFTGKVDKIAFDHCLERLNRAKNDRENPGGLDYVAGFFESLSIWRSDLLFLFIADEEDECLPVPDFGK